ncbi:MAG: PAS domain-containing protein [Opitutaceae bacterium]|nr:PAS domain-containing protein [Opitutaceae bacterium]
MRHFRDWSVRTKLTLIALLACSTAVALACVALFVYEVRSFKRTLVTDLRAQAATLAGLSTAALTFDDAATASEMLGELKNQPHVRWAVIYKEGRAFAHYLHPSLDGALPAPPAAGFDEHVDSDGVRLATDIRVKGDRVGRLYIAADATRLRTRLREYGEILGAVFLVSIFSALFMATRLQRAIFIPVQRLAEAAREVAEKQDYSVRIPRRGSDELGRMTDAFNAMLGHIQTQDTALRESQQRFEVAVAGARDGIWDWNLLTGEIYFSRQWKAMLGYEEHEITGGRSEWLALFFDPAERADTVRALDEYLAGRRPQYEVEVRLRHKDGSVRWILSRGAALRDATGRPCRMAGSHTDITERKLAEEQVRSSRAHFEVLVNSINGIVWEADALKSQVLYVNAQAERVLGFPVRAWLDEPGFWEKTIHRDDWGETRRAIRRAIFSGRDFQHEHRVVTADGRVVWLRASVAVQRMADGEVRLRGLAMDITAQKNAAEEMARMQRELVAASRQAGMAEVATGVLHNVGNVLNSVNVSAGLIVDQLRRSKTESLARAVEVLRARHDNLGEFMAHDPKGRQLPAFFGAVSDELARERAGLLEETKALQQNVDHIKQIVAMQQAFAKVSGLREPLDLAEVMEDALRLAGGALPPRRIEIVRDFAAVPKVMGDRHRVLQILVNLLSNAGQALQGREEGRRLVLRTDVTGFNRVRLAVTDNGEGIAPENIARIFSHGFTTKKTGHGFGLHSGANAAKEMGGSLTVHSDGPGRGATFTLELPVRASDEQVEAAAA